jgi:hypothetical protein
LLNIGQNFVICVKVRVQIQIKIAKTLSKNGYEPFGCEGATEKLFANRLWSGGVGDDC